MTKRQTRNAFAWWCDWWNKLSPFEQLFIEVMGAVSLALILTKVSIILWS